MQTGLADTDAIIEDFLVFRNFVERNALLDMDNFDVTGDAISVASSNSPHGSNSTPFSHYFDDRSLFSYSTGTSSLHGSLGRFSNGDVSHSHESESRPSDLSDDEASIHCDISDEEMLDCEDMKQPARPSSRVGNLYGS